METTRNQPLVCWTKYENMLKPKSRVASLMSLVDLISKKEAVKILEVSKKSRLVWR